MDRVSDEELAKALAENLDEDGNDVGLERWVSSWSPEQRRRSTDNLRSWVAAARRAAESAGDDHDGRL